MRRMSSRRLAFFIPLIVFCVLALVFAQLLFSEKRIGPGISPLVGQPVPDFTLEAVEGVNRPLLTPEILEINSPSILNVFASWCAPCRIEHPELMSLTDDGVVVYGIAYKDKAVDIRRYLNAGGNPYAAIGSDPKGQAQLALGLSGVPETFVIDNEGVIRAHVRGPLTPLIIRDVILPALVPKPTS